MAILPVLQEDVEVFDTIINPIRTYVTSSSGATGSILLYSRVPRVEKEIRPLNNFNSSFVNDQDLESFRTDVVRSISLDTKNFSQSAENYLNLVNNQSISAKKQKIIYINRFTPSVSFTSNTLRKLNVKNSLMSYYSTIYPSAHWAYTNYHSLNFFTSPSVPTSSALLFPNLPNSHLEKFYTYVPKQEGHVDGIYSLSGAFSLDFNINPRYGADDNKNFKAATILHLSSSYALSLITGSKKDNNGMPLSFRLQLQLSHSADIPPSLAVPGPYPNDLIFLSDDNSLDFNNWHRAVVRWGTNVVNNGTGSFNINGIEKGHFVVPSGTINPRSYYFSANDDPRVLCIGNFYEGTNQGTEAQAYFFSDVVSNREGLNALISDNGSQDEPTRYFFKHPLKAEVHDLIIHRRYLTNENISSTFDRATGSIDRKNTAFYLPPFFVETAPIRKFTNAPSLMGTAHGGILQTPFFSIDGSTNDPFNVAMSFGVNGHYINLENFTKDFSNEIFPRLHQMSGSTIDYTTEAKEANEFLYDDSFVRRRNLLIMPCDDGNFIPNFNFLFREPGKKFIDDHGRLDLSLITLNDLLNTSSLLFGSTHDAEHASLTQQQIGFTPENPGIPPGPAVSNLKNSIKIDDNYDPSIVKETPLTIFQRTKDPSSNQVIFFDISNLFYGSRILPGSLKITDTNLTGSSGKISITLQDDKYGNIYRADSLTPHCKWNSVGNIFYNEGIVVIKSPHLYFFGKNGYEMSFIGEQQLSTSKYEILAPQGYLNSSSNPTYSPIQNLLKPSGDPLDTGVFSYISNLNFHDENLNVIAKATFSQPVLKREPNKILFKITFDF